MALQIAGQTTHFTVRYDDTIGTPALGVANAVVAICEIDLFKLSLYMPYKSSDGQDPFISPQPSIDVQIVNDPLQEPAFSSADNDGFSPGRQSRIRINAFSDPGVAISDDYAGFAFVAEMAEILMGFYGWDASSSQGEALSRVMAEELHPASAKNFVNDWLGWPRPRPDWISRNEFSSTGLGPPRGDTDPYAYGCGIIFIYFLRYQLGFTYDRICGAGGSLLSDRYKNLTTATDDPSLRVNNLLDKHFGSGTVQLVGNNPFPLFDGADRRIDLAFSKPSATPSYVLASGTAHIKPFFSCPAADYPYTEQGWNRTQIITASTVGIGIPKFTWYINGKELEQLSYKSSFLIEAEVDIPDPQNPDVPKHDIQNFAFDYLITNIFDSTGGRSLLTITSQSINGDYNIEVQVDADERVAPTTPVSVQQSLTIPTRTIEYGGNYDADKGRCMKAFEKVISSKLHSLQQMINILHTLPDPPPPDYLKQVLAAVIRIQTELDHLATTDHAAANRIANYITVRTGLPPQTFLRTAATNLH